jgi:hypothetical protein
MSDETIVVGPAVLTIGRNLATPLHRRLDRLVARDKTRRRWRLHKTFTVSREPAPRATQPLFFEGSVWYFFKLAINLLSIVGEIGPPPVAIALVPSSPVVGTPFVLGYRPQGRSSARYEARAIVKSLMVAGLDLFCQRTRPTFHDGFDIVSEEQLAVAQREWAWKTTLTDDLRMRWAYAAFRLRYLTS